MTREEAIKKLQKQKAEYLEEWVDYSGIAEAFDMAIEALSREQKKYDAICKELCELKNDLNLPIEVAMAYEKSINVVRKYAKMSSLCDNCATVGCIFQAGIEREKCAFYKNKDDLFCKSQLITCNFVKACNGVCPFEDALKHADRG